MNNYKITFCKSILFLLPVALTLSACAQNNPSTAQTTQTTENSKTIIDPKDQKSKVELFSSKSGSLIKKEFVDVGTVRKCGIAILELTDLLSNEKIRGVRFQLDVVSSYTTDTKSAFLDFDEIDALLKALKMIKENVLTTIPANYTEVVYKSRGGFQAGCFKSNNGWDSFIKLEQFDGKSYVWFKEGDLDQLIKLISDSKFKI